MWGAQKIIFLPLLNCSTWANNQIYRDTVTREKVQTLFHECTFAGAIIIETWGQSGQLRLICHSESIDKGGLSFGTSQGRKAIYTDMEKQMFGK